MSKCVGIKHGEKSRVYWFSVPDGLRDISPIGANVICNTRIGETPGVIVKIMEGLTRQEVERIIPKKYLTLKNIVAVETEQILSNIIIPFDMEMNETPSPEELAGRVREFYTTGGFRDVLFSSDGTLLKGYSAYMVSRMLGHNTLKGLVVSSERDE